MNTHKSINLPIIFNYLYDSGYIQSLSSNETSLFFAILYKLNRLYFPDSIQISNTELGALANLTPKQVRTARETLLKKGTQGELVLSYKHNGNQRIAGDYSFNYELMRHSRVSHEALKENSGGEKSDPVPREYAPEGNDHNKLTNKTSSSSRDEIKFDDDDIPKEIKDTVIETLKIHRMPEAKITQVVIKHGWQNVIIAFCDTRQRYELGKVENFTGYFLKILENGGD